MSKRCNNLTKWNEFISNLKEEASSDDQHILIDFKKFEQIVNEVLGLKISEK